MDKKIIPKPPPPPPARPLSSAFISGGRVKRFDNQNSNQIPTEKRTLCPLSHPTNRHVLIAISGKHTSYRCFSCDKHYCFNHDNRFCYHCTTCDVEFHDGCHKFPRKVTHPYHLQHPLTFTFCNSQTGIISEGKIDKSFRREVLYDSGRSQPNTSYPNKSDKCTWCGKNILGKWFYRCSLCNFCLDLSCYQNIPPLIITNPRSHHHSLVFYPRPLLTPCDACGIVNEVEPSYACFQCNYMVHQSCIDLPRVIKITRHPHRLIHTPYIQPITSPCRICYKTVDGKYGQYSCNHEDCSYVTHSKCATHENVWDGKELEWEPEESENPEDIAPFKNVGHGLIKHFSHEHILKLEKYDGVRDAEKQCQACVLPINSHDFYNCMECDFSLHEVCVGLLRKLDHALHVHTLVLDPSHEDSPEHFYNAIGCSVCSRKFSGFRYKCSKKDCVLTKGFQIDVRCVLVPDYFTHKSHEHPLFISTSYKDKGNICCRGCNKTCMESYLQCSICEFSLCYQCATIPSEVSYKYDKHPLSLCYGEREGAEGTYWCEVCEKKVNPIEWFYVCNECCVTVHLECLFGDSVYMKHGFIFNYIFPRWKHLSSKLKVIRNSNSTRPLCVNCGDYCPSYVYYRSHGYRKVSLCSLDCLVKRNR